MATLITAQGETLALSSDGTYDATFKRYANGAVMLTQGNDHVYLSDKQIAVLSKFLEFAK